MAKLRAMKGKRGGKASYLKINPSNPEALARIWKAWTGSDADKTLHIEIDQARKFGLPSQVVLLGRLTWLATAKGGVKKFSADGPLLVTDAEARKVWILSAKPQKFDLEPSLIAYLARKPKFGDKNLIEYVHAFEGRAHAVMDGQVGALTGTFRVTPAGLEG